MGDNGFTGDRRTRARAVRVAAARSEYGRAVPRHLANGEEVDYPYLANFSKGLPHDGNGEVDPAAYQALLRALATGEERHFEAVPLGTPGGRHLLNPRAGAAFELLGPDPQAFPIPPAPRVDGAEHSAEAVELYWMALCRDVPFRDFAADRRVAAAAEELDGLPGYRGPRLCGRVTPATLFRGDAPGELVGPYVSQYLLRDIPNGTLRVPQRQDVPPPGLDHLTDYPTWLACQNGQPLPQVPRDQHNRYHLRTPRDLAHYVGYDHVYQAALGAAQILQTTAPVDPGNPYRTAVTEQAFGTYGPPHALALVAEVAIRAMRAVWYLKWYVHRRARPEEFGGLVHRHLAGTRRYDMIHPAVLGSRAVAETYERFGSRLLPQAHSGGSPLHPAYGAGHAATVGACVTLLKAWYDCSAPIEDPVEPDADGLRLIPYTGDDADRMTVGGELDKLAGNISIARNIAGVHWRTDYTAGVRLGERIAVALLRQVTAITAERGSLTLRRFDGGSEVI
ncbi:vanadium-dependent haloperoxidase [Allostreptomyces psammosilenae]|uniref:Vanadium-dependent haloperoxidase n=1 Tax=Allostreptomyces psammosilenae TaxID=1892865 RepID=A0A853ADH6_9ACTN|nr:vanadium-dependent haloperoxidase [Allostreptomyces psammosilenae]NYI08382.1 hypothetical protein [Allostreptomyces psammosilenae]